MIIFGIAMIISVLLDIIRKFRELPKFVVVDDMARKVTINLSERVMELEDRSDKQLKTIEKLLTVIKTNEKVSDSKGETCAGD